VTKHYVYAIIWDGKEVRGQSQEKEERSTRLKWQNRTNTQTHTHTQCNLGDCTRRSTDMDEEEMRREETACLWIRKWSKTGWICDGGCPTHPLIDHHISSLFHPTPSLLVTAVPACCCGVVLMLLLFSENITCDFVGVKDTVTKFRHDSTIVKWWHITDV
jgi:hypothetical protein